MSYGTPRIPRPNLDAYERAGKVPADNSIMASDRNHRVMATIGCDNLLNALHRYYDKMGWRVCSDA